MVTCPACGTQLRVDAKFCDECGASVAGASASAEYKQVTVLFADVVHSMEIAGVVGTERLRELMSDVLDRCSEVVQRYSGTVDKFTGDGVMAVFGAPISLEDHAIRACLAALEIQRQTADVAAEVKTRDGIDLMLRLGLSSGEVIAGGIGSRSHDYTAVGDQVGMAQRMQTVAQAGGIMLSESTARLVEGEASLGERQLVAIKGFEIPVAAYELLAVTGRHTERPSRTASFVGRDWEMTALTAMLDRSINGHGCVVGIVGLPGIGKSRTVAEVAELAAHRGVRVTSTYCESHTSDVPFQTANRLLRAAWGMDSLAVDAARDVVRRTVPGAHLADLVLLYDELGIRDPDDPLPDIAPEARRRRLTALVNATVLARSEPALFVIEDAHWIDPASEELVAGFLSVVPRSKALVLITYRPQYAGALSRTPGAQTIALAPLENAQIAGLVGELVGTQRALAALTDRVTERASGNPFFAEEIVRDLADRGVLLGERGAYTCADNVSDADVPATLQAAIAARIDRLAPEAKQALNAAAVIGLRFEEGLLTELAGTGEVEPLLKAELIDQVAFTPRQEYAFRHPLTREVAYRSQLASARADLHRRLAVLLEAEDPGSADERASLIAENLEAAGELRKAFDWHMRAGNWLTFRDISAGRQSWQRAKQVADRMAVDDPRTESMRIEPRALLCGTAFRGTSDFDEVTFEETCRLADAAGDLTSLAMAMAGRILALTFRGRYGESSRMASEARALIESIGDPMLELKLLPGLALSKLAHGELPEALSLIERIIELADDDPVRGASLVESPLSLALMFRAVSRMLLGAPGWKDDLSHAAETTGKFNAIGQPVLMFWKYAAAVAAGALLADGAAVAETAEILEIAEQRSDDLSLVSARFLHGFILAQQPDPERSRGLVLLATAREATIQQRSIAVILPLIEIELAREISHHGDFDHAVATLRKVLDGESGSGGVGSYVRAAEVLVELLLERGGPDDLIAAAEAVDRFAAESNAAGVAIYDVALLRLRAVVARACGNENEYREYVDRYRAMAREFDFDGHIAMAESMLAQGSDSLH